jgi:hypothetical protein
LHDKRHVGTNFVRVSRDFTTLGPSHHVQFLKYQIVRFGVKENNGEVVSENIVDREGPLAILRIAVIAIAPITVLDALRTVEARCQELRLRRMKLDTHCKYKP